jgi:serine protease Do
MQPRDVIVSINRQPVSSVDDVKRIQASIKAGDAVAFRVMRADRRQRPVEWVSLFLAGTLPSTQ